MEHKSAWPLDIRHDTRLPPCAADCPACAAEKKAPLRFIVVALSMWKWEGVIAVGGTIAEFVAFAKQHGATKIEETASTTGRAYVELGVPWFLWVKSLDDVPALAHEALHVTSGILECRGLKHTADSEEAYTYTMEGIIRAALTATEWETVPEPPETEG